MQPNYAFNEYLITREDIRAFLITRGEAIRTSGIRLIGGNRDMEFLKFEAWDRTNESGYVQQSVRVYVFSKEAIINYLNASGATEVTQDWDMYVAVYSILADGRTDETALVVTNNLERSQETRGRDG